MVRRTWWERGKPQTVGNRVAWALKGNGGVGIGCRAWTPGRVQRVLCLFRSRSMPAHSRSAGPCHSRTLTAAVGRTRAGPVRGRARSLPRAHHLATHRCRAEDEHTSGPFRRGCGRRACGPSFKRCRHTCSCRQLWPRSVAHRRLRASPRPEARPSGQ